MFSILLKRISRVLLIVLSTLLIFGALTSPAKGNSLVLSANGAVLIDVQSGRILYQKNAAQQMRVASLTKIMTAIVAIEDGDLSKMVTTSNRAYGVEGSSIYLKKGEKLSLEDMLYGLMLRSGNDAAVAIAEHIGGSVEGFVFLMNEKAAYLGMNDTHFMNPHGLDHKDHYSTPQDMAILTAYALQNPIFKKIVSTKVKTAPMEGEEWVRKWYNKNRLLTRYQWADGVKTGFTKLSRRCLASSATKDNVQLAVITLNASDDWNDHIKLLEYGFNNFTQVALIEKGETLDNLAKIEKGTLVAAKDFTYPLAKDEIDEISKKVVLDSESIKTGLKQAGHLEFYLKDKYIGSIEITLKNEDIH